MTPSSGESQCTVHGDRRARGRAWWSIAIPAGIALLSVFALPWHFPPAERVAGPSYALGFNNQLAVMGLVTAILVAVALSSMLGTSRASLQACSVRGRGPKTHGSGPLDWLLPETRLLPRYELARGEYTVVALSGVLLCAATLLLNELLVVPYWGEASYFLSRIDLVALGYRPYVDFHHNYGPLLLYLPVWLQRSSAGLLGLEDAYALCVATGCVLGLFGQFVLLRALRLPPKFRWVVLLCTTLPWTTLTLGLNYVPLRFTAVPAGIVLLHVNASRLARATATAALAGAFSLGVSPEMGLAMGLAVLAYSGVSALNGDLRRACALGLAAAVGPLPYLVFAPRYLWSLAAFARGYNNLPVYPNFHNLLFVAVCLATLPPLLVAIWQNRQDQRAPLAAALVIAGGCLIGPALGRCDPGHVIINSIIPVSLAFAASAAWGSRMFWGWCATQVIAAGLLLQISFWNHYAGVYRIALERLSVHREHPELVEQWRIQWQSASDRMDPNRRLAWTKVAPFPTAFEALLQTHRVVLPLATPDHAGVDRLLKLQPGFRPPYHPIPVPEIASPHDAARVAADALRYDIIVLPPSARTAANETSARETRSAALADWLSRLMLFPVATNAIREPFLGNHEVYRRLLAECDVLAEGQDAVLLTPRQARNASPRRAGVRDTSAE